MKEPWFGRRARSVESQSDEPSQHSDSSSQDEVIDIKGDQFSGNKDEVTSLNLSSWDMVALGLTTAIGGHYFAWNAGLSIGFGGFIIILFMISSAYYCLVLCMAELSSALPFAGGAYGIARVTLGIFPGFLVAVCDSFKSIIYAATAAYSIGGMMTIVTQDDSVNEYGYWFAFYILCLAVHLYGGKIFWRINFTLAALSVTILFIYIFGAIKFAHFKENAAYPGADRINKWFHGDLFQFITVLPLATRFFQGIQSINLACGQIKDPKKEVPRGYIISMTFVMFTSFAVLFLATAVKPGLKVFIVRLRPLSSGFKQMFALPPFRATIISIPATVMSGFGFMYYYGQQLSAMGKSGLLNPCFGWELPGRGTPYVALLTGSVLGYMLCIIQKRYPDTEDQIYALSILGATATFLSIFVSYIMFRNYFPTIKREFVSPLGEAGAVYGFLIFALCFISVCGFQKDQVAIIVFVIIIAVASIYYYFVVRKRQIFSEEEKTVMFKAYLMKNNAAKANRIRRGPSGGSGGSGGVQGGSGSNSNNNSNNKPPQKKSVMIMSRIEVGPVNGSGGEGGGEGGEASGEHRRIAQTPTSATILVPYRPAEPAHEADNEADTEAVAGGPMSASASASMFAPQLEMVAEPSGRGNTGCTASEKKKNSNWNGNRGEPESGDIERGEAGLSERRSAKYPTTPTVVVGTASH